MRAPHDGFNPPSDGNSGIPPFCVGQGQTGPMPVPKPEERYQFTSNDVDEWKQNGYLPTRLKALCGQLIPPGRYQAVTADDLRGESAHGTCFYKLFFEITSGPYKGVVACRLFWLTEKGLRSSMPICALLGAEHLESLVRSNPIGIDCQIDVELGKDERGRDANMVQWISLPARMIAPPPSHNQEGGPHHG